MSINKETCGCNNFRRPPGEFPLPAERWAAAANVAARERLTLALARWAGALGAWSPDKDVAAALLAPDRTAIRAHLEAITEGWPAANLLELRGIAEGRPPRARLFLATPDGLEEAAETAARWNAGGWNTYSGIHARRPGTSTDRAASAGKVVDVARWVVADLDDVPDAEERLRTLPIAPQFVVVTGSVPRVRAHAWWRLAEEVPLAKWSELQRNLAEHLGADSSLNDPARVVRLAGSVAWPKAAKRARGYVPERTRTERWSDAPATVTTEALCEMAGASGKAHEGVGGDAGEDDWTDDLDVRPALPAPSLARIRSALAFIAPDDRAAWLRVGAALKAHTAATGDQIEDVFIAWSRGDLRREGPRIPRGFAGEDDCLRLLASLRRDECEP